jgi:type IV pilus assembly protein PilA
VDISRRNPETEDGFTLIELMVVLLIIAILLAIAVPTFLGSRDTANARATEATLRNGLSAEATYWASNQSFATGLSSVEGDLNWTTGTVTDKGGNTVAVALYQWVAVGTPPATGSAGDSDSVELYGYAQDGNCYAIFVSNNPSTSFTAYDDYAASSGCGPAAPPSAVPTPGTFASATRNWAASF